MSKVMIMVNASNSLLNFRLELIESLLNEKHEVCISSPPGDALSKLSSMGCKCIEQLNLSRHGLNPLKELKLINDYKRLLKKEKPDIVFSYTIKPNIYGGIACAKYGIKFVPNITGLGTSIQNGGLKRKIMLALYRKGLKRARTVFFQNQANQEFFIKNKIVRGRTILLPGSGVNLNKHNYVPYPADDETLIFTFVGRLMVDKGIVEFVQAASAIKKSYNNIIFQAVGSCEPEFETQLAELKAVGSVIFLGFSSDVHAIMSKSHAVVLPSYHEGLANVLLEAAACGRPVIASRVPGCIETFEEGVTGFGCSSKNSEELSNAIEKMIKLSNAQRSEMGMKGRHRVEQKFDRRIVVKRYLDEIKEVVKEREKDYVTL